MAREGTRLSRRWRPRSLLARLLLWLLVPLGVSSLVGAWISLREATRTATLVQDRLLLGSARIIAQQIQFEEGMLDVAIPPAALELFQTDTQDQVYYRVAASNGTLLSGYVELPPPPLVLRPEESAAFGSNVRGEAVRVVAYAQPVFAAPSEGPVVIEVAQTLQSRSQMIRQLWLTSLRQEGLMLALVAFLVWVALHQGLRSILWLRDTVQGRVAGTLEPLDPGPVPSEIRPLVTAINDYVDRLDAQVSARNRFIANASHQLRTPLTVLQTQIGYGLKTTDPGEKDEAMRALFLEVQEATRLVNQLLSLSAAESRRTAAEAHPRVDLSLVVQRVLEECAALSQSKEIDLGFEGTVREAFVEAAPAMLHELVANLVENALRYTPNGGVVTAGISRLEDFLVLRIEDNGPGIPPEERERVFERFYRLRGVDTPGSGLGLAIVQEVAASMGATVDLSDPPKGRGLVVSVRFPQQAPPSP